MSRYHRVELGQLPVALRWRWRKYYRTLRRQFTKLYGGNVPNFTAAMYQLYGGNWRRGQPDKIPWKFRKPKSPQMVCITTDVFRHTVSEAAEIGVNVFPTIFMLTAKPPFRTQ